ncbi:hypothetical protein DL771_002809 [Monosporascus sp. 5C6A]|nr:hypothetical protein DL771_002809 [Monosporascus sp. 5C6A]
MEYLHLSLPQIAASSLLIALLPFILKGIRNPLRHVPGPWYSRWIGWVMTYHDSVGTGPAYVHNLHKQYGPVVRVRPYWVDTMNPEDTQTIYRIKNEFKKSEAYRTSPDIIPLDIFSVRDVDVHRRWRRLLSHPLSEGGLKEVLPQVEANVRLAIKQIGQEMKVKGAADVYKWWMCMATDIIGELTFGESFRMLQTGKYILDIEAQSVAGAIITLVPWIRKIPSVLLPHSLVDKIEAFFRVGTHAETLLDRYRARLDNDPQTRPTLFTKLIKATDDDILSPSELRDNARLYVIAGSDTTSNTLTYLVWQTCRHPAVKEKLVKEATSLPDNFTAQQLKDLPYLNLVILETLRLHSAAPAGLSRVVPPEGAMIGGYGLPGGTVVASQAWSLHRNPDVFPAPDDFKPERWENPSKRMKDAFHPFGGGSRILLKTRSNPQAGHCQTLLTHNKKAVYGTATIPKGGSTSFYARERDVATFDVHTLKKTALG